MCDGSPDPAPAIHPLADTLAPLFSDYIAASPVEQVIVAGCDPQGRLHDFIIVSQHDPLKVGHVDKAISRILGHPRVRTIILAHNHPCGTAVPSQADIAVTRRMAAFARLGGGELADHLLYANGAPQSFRALGLL